MEPALSEKRPVWKYARCIPLNHTGGAAALALHARINSAKGPRTTPVRDVLSLSLRAHIGAFVSAAAAKCVSSATMDPLPDLRETPCLKIRPVRPPTPQGGAAALVLRARLSRYEPTEHICWRRSIS